MQVKQLIALLQEMPQEADVGCVYDGAIRTPVEAVWLARSGEVALAGIGDSVYSTRDRPESAPTKETEPYWGVPTQA